MTRLASSWSTFFRQPTQVKGAINLNLGRRAHTRQRPSKRLSAQPGADLVGPPDANSNLRPVIYGSAFEENEARKRQSQDSGSQSLSSSPYSTTEFTAQSAASASSSSSSPLSSYYASLVARLEVAELEHHLRRARSDRFSQSFWDDNNRRYAEALERYQSSVPEAIDDAQGSSQGTRATSPGQTAADTKPESTSKGLSANSSNNPKQDLLAPFYAAWLSANSARHKAYNKRLWAMTKENLGPALRYAVLRKYVVLVRWLQESGPKSR